MIAKPNAPKTQLLGERDGALLIALKAPAEENKANIELIKFFAKQGFIAKIVRGLTSKRKFLVLEQKNKF